MMKRSALLLAASLLPYYAVAQSVPDAPPVRAESYILVDAQTGQVLAERNPDDRRDPASITKVMTIYVTHEEIANGRASLDDKVLISEKAWRQGIDSTQSRMFVEVGTLVRLEDLLRGVIIQSGNDASVAVAEHIAGSEPGFANMMNATAERLGMRNSSFRNSSGMPEDGHYSTARDIAMLAMALANDHPEGYAVYSEREFTYNGIRQFNRNRLLWRDDSVDGVKTGYTSRAGYCLASSAKRDGRRLVAVVLGAPGEDQRAQDSLALLNYGFRFFENATLVEAGQAIDTLRIYGGEQSELRVGIPEGLLASVPRGGRDRLQVDTRFRTPLTAPIRAGDVVGELTIRLDDEVLRSEALVALEDVAEGGLIKRAIDNLRLRIGI